MFKKITNDGTPFIIAEVGQNHNGDLKLAREYIKVFAYEGADAVKFQTRNNKHLFSEESYNAEYNSENAFAATYGAHRELLELKPEWLSILKDDCKKYGVKFMSTPFDEPSLELIIENDIEIIKIASFDLGNLPFINKIAKQNKPVVISVGGGNHDQIISSVDLLLKNKIEVALLHCVSEYPCPFNKLGLENIEKLTKNFPDCTIGSSDHFNGTLSGPIAYMLGARVFEKHVTLNRSNKGTDHSFALEPFGFRKFVRDIKRVRYMLPQKPLNEIGEEQVFKKLGKSLITNKNLKKGDLIKIEDLSGRIFKKQYIPVRRSNEIIGKKVLKNLEKNNIVNFTDIEN